LITCEHASNAVPEDLADLGLDENLRGTHIAIDIGAAALAAVLRDRLQARLIEAVYSRLVVDLNRYPDDHSVILPESDTVTVPANQNLSPDQRRSRIRRFHTPYHETVARTLDELQAVNEVVNMVFLHSFTPQMNGVQRPWDVGLLFHDDGLAAQRAARVLDENTRFCVGYNEPYKASEPKSYALYEHAVERQLDYLAIEVRQDLLVEPESIERVGRSLAPAILAAFNPEPGS